MLHTNQPAADTSVRNLRDRYLDQSRGETPANDAKSGAPSQGSRSAIGRLLRSRWWIAILLPSIAAGAAVMTGIATPPTYTVKGSLLVTFSRDYVYRPLVGASETILPWRPETIVNSELEILSSDDLKRGVVEKIGTTKLLEPALMSAQAQAADTDEARIFGNALALLRDGLTVKAIKDSNVMNVSFRHTNADTAVEVVKVLVSDYLAKRVEIYSTQNVTFLEEAVADRERALEAAIRSQQHYKRDNGLIRHEEERASLQQREVTLLGERDRLQRELAEASGERKVIEPLRGSQSDGLARIEAQISGATDSLGEVERQLQSINDRLQELEARKGVLDMLANNVTFEQSRLEQVRSRLDEARLNQALDRSQISNVRVVEAPHKPDRKDGLTLSTRVGVAIAAGFLAALGLIAFLGRAATPVVSEPRSARTPTIV